MYNIGDIVRIIGPGCANRGNSGKILEVLPNRDHRPYFVKVFRGMEYMGTYYYSPEDIELEMNMEVLIECIAWAI